VWTKKASSRSRSNRTYTAETAYERAVRFLAARPRSEAEVRRRLRLAGVEESLAEQAIARLGNEGLLDDQQFSSYWVEQRLAFRPRGPRALSFELRGKGVSRAAMAAALEIGLREQGEAACRAVTREARRHADAPEHEFSAILTKYLVRRGFDPGVTRAAIRELRKQVLTTEALTG
jgi:regulatory protein